MAVLKWQYNIIENPSGYEVDPERSNRTDPANLQQATQRFLNLIFAAKYAGLLSLVSFYLQLKQGAPRNTRDIGIFTKNSCRNSTQIRATGRWQLSLFAICIPYSDTVYVRSMYLVSNLT